MRLAIVSATALLAMGCTSPRGINTGECVDLMDNDVDGLVDCFDPDCIAAGACGDVDTTTPAGQRHARHARHAAGHRWW